MRARSNVMSLHFYLWGLNSWKSKLGRTAEQIGLSVRILNLSQSPGEKTLASESPFPLGYAQGVHCVRGKINPGIALLYLPSGLNHIMV